MNRDSASKVKVLLVDDNPVNLLSLKAILDELDLQLVEGHSGNEALGLLTEHEFAVILLDVQMPNLGGFETARLIRGRADSRHTPIIFQSAYDADRATIERAYSLGAVDFLLKPLMPVVLRSKVQGFVELFQHKEKIKQQAEQLRLAERQEFQEKLIAENALLYEERERLRVTLTSIGDGVITTDPEGCVTFLNPVAESLTGWTNETAAGRPLHTVFHIVNEITRQTVENPVAKVLATDGIVGLANHTVLIAKDGSEQAIDDSAAPIRNCKGEVAGVVLVFRDVTERREAERIAKLLASIVETSDDAIIGKDSKGVITSWNQAAERLFGYSASEAIGHPISILAPMDRQDEMPAIMARLKQGQRIEHFDTVRRGKDGRLLPISLTVSPIKDEDGNIVGASKIARDISERKRAEAALYEEKELLHTTLVSIGDAVIVTDGESRITMMNPVAQMLTGWKEEAVGQPLDDVFRIINEQSRQSVESPVRRVMREGVVVGLANHTVLIAKSGNELPIDDSAAPICDHQGQVIGCVLVFREITERRQAERALQETRKLLAAELEEMTRLHALSSRLMSSDDLGTALDDLLVNAIAASGADFGNIQYYDSAVGALEIIAQRGFSKKFLDHFRQVRIDEGSSCAQAMHSGQRIVIEDVNTDADFEPHREIAAAAGYRAVQSTPLKNRAGVVIGMLSTHFRMPHRPSQRDEQLLDIYARHATELIERNQFETALIDADRHKDNFLATLAHELRNPLAPLNNALEIMKVASDDKTVTNEARSIMQRQVGQLVRLVDDLLDVSRINSGKLQVRKERILLSEVIATAIESTRPLIDASVHDLTVLLPPQPIYVNADRTRLTQVFLNLLNNAAKYMDKAGHIWLTVERHNSEVRVSVRDTGIGLAAEHLTNIFGMFSQVDSALERSQGGLGIGLSLVKGLVELHGGTIEAHSAGLGKGTEFVVRLPIVNGPEEDLQNPVDRSQSVGNSRKCRVLVVDDLRDSAYTMSMMLEMRGHETFMAFDGLEAVQAAATYRPDLIFLDIGLPKLNGYEAARQIRNEPWGTKMVLVALTGWGQEDDKRRSTEVGFDHHLTKPVDINSLDKLLALIVRPD